MHSYVGDSGGQCVRNGIRPQEAIIVFFLLKPYTHWPSLCVYC